MTHWTRYPTPVGVSARHERANSPDTDEQYPDIHMFVHGVTGQFNTQVNVPVSRGYRTCHIWHSTEALEDMLSESRKKREQGKNAEIARLKEKLRQAREDIYQLREHLTAVNDVTGRAQYGWLFDLDEMIGPREPPPAQPEPTPEPETVDDVIILGDESVTE